MDDDGGCCGCLLGVVVVCLAVLAVAVTVRLVDKILSGSSFVG